MLKVILNRIYRMPRLAKQGLMVANDALLSAVCTWIALGLRIDYWGAPNSSGLVIFFVSVALSLPLFYVFGLYRAIFRHIGTAAFISIVKIFTLYAISFFIVFTVIGIESIPKSIGVIQPLLFFVAIGITRYSARAILSLKRDGDNTSKIRKVFIYGTGFGSRKISEGIARNGEIRILGFIDDDPEVVGKTINAIPVYSEKKIKELITKLAVTDIFLSSDRDVLSKRTQIILNLGECGVRVRLIPSVIDLVMGDVYKEVVPNIEISELLGRQVVNPHFELCNDLIKENSILITGAGGSIGSELCRQIIMLNPKTIVLYENNEYALFSIHKELMSLSGALNSFVRVVPCLGSVGDVSLLTRTLSFYSVNIVFHAAAYKHVSLVEENPLEGLKNNIFGTVACVDACISKGVSNFVLISTDKAVRPTNVMGASKRVAELILQAKNDIFIKKIHSTRLSMVRFGNVLDSSGSVIPIFREQIISGGPITLTHPDIVRYFMTIPEAAQLVIQSCSMATGGDVFVLDMGAPVRIYDLARRMISLSGLLVKDENCLDGDIKIEITGLKPGEKLYEELLIGNNPEKTCHPKILKAHEKFLEWSILEVKLNSLNSAINSGDITSSKQLLRELVPEFELRS